MPKNTTLRLQPLHAGNIIHFKVHYCRLLLQHTLSQIDRTAQSASGMVKSIDIVMAIRCVKQAQENVTSRKITNRNSCGSNDDDEDPFPCFESDVDCGESVLQELVAAFDTTSE